MKRDYVAETDYFNGPEFSEFLEQFGLGCVRTTVAAYRACLEAGVDPVVLLHRHSKGDWGDVSEDDGVTNDAALLSGAERIYSSYLIANEQQVWVVTKCDRSTTILCLPEEYV